MSGYVDYKGLQVISPSPAIGTPARTIDDNFRTLIDNYGNANIIGSFSATSWAGA